MSRHRVTFLFFLSFISFDSLISCGTRSHAQLCRSASKEKLNDTSRARSSTRTAAGPFPCVARRGKREKSPPLFLPSVGAGGPDTTTTPTTTGRLARRHILLLPVRGSVGWTWRAADARQAAAAGRTFMRPGAHAIRVHRRACAVGAESAVFYSPPAGRKVGRLSNEKSRCPLPPRSTAMPGAGAGDAGGPPTD